MFSHKRIAIAPVAVGLGIAVDRFSVGALGQLSPDRDSLRLVPNCNVLPGFQWHVNDAWWLSSAVLMPVGPVRAAPGQWQLTCSLQF